MSAPAWIKTDSGLVVSINNLNTARRAGKVVQLRFNDATKDELTFPNDDSAQSWIASLATVLEASIVQGTAVASLTSINPASVPVVTAETIYVAGNNFQSGGYIFVPGSSLTAANTTLLGPGVVSVAWPSDNGLSSGTHDVQYYNPSGVLVVTLAGALTLTALSGKAYGTITCLDKASYANNQTEIVTDAGANEITVEYKVDGTFVTAGGTVDAVLDISAMTTAAQVAAGLLGKLTDDYGGGSLNMTITQDGAVVVLVDVASGVGGNVALVGTSPSARFGMTGGA